jgi:hypothetical protein
MKVNMLMLVSAYRHNICDYEHVSFLCRQQRVCLLSKSTEFVPKELTTNVSGPYSVCLGAKAQVSSTPLNARNERNIQPPVLITLSPTHYGINLLIFRINLLLPSARLKEQMCKFLPD